MFGLMKARTCSASAEQKQFRRLHYCGTCKTLGSLYGQRSRLFLNHDTVFLAELLTTISATGRAAPIEPVGADWDPAYMSFNCMSMPDSNGAGQAMPLPLRIAAAATVVLSDFKIADHEADSGKRRWKIARRVFGPGFGTARAELKQWEFPIDRLDLALTSQAEREFSVRFGAAPDLPEDLLARVAEPTATATALFFQQGVRIVGRAEVAESAGAVGYAFGKLVYLLDAFEDYGKDFRSGNFNAIRSAFELSGETLATGPKTRVLDWISSLTAEIETGLTGLPLDSRQAAIFVSRLKSNVASRLKTRLPVLQALREGTKCAIEPSAGEEGDGTRSLHSPGPARNLWQRLRLKKFHRQRHSTDFQATSIRERLGLFMNLMYLGYLARSVVDLPLWFAADAPGGGGSEGEGAVATETAPAGQQGKKKSGGCAVCGCDSDCCDCCECAECCDCCNGCDC